MKISLYVGLLALGLGSLGEASSIAVYGTGVSVDPCGVDRNYALTASTDPNVKGTAAYVTDNIWGPQLAGTQWINPTGHGRDGSQDYLYTYTTKFNLSGLVASTAVLTGSVLADDQVTLYLNGSVVGTPGMGTYTASTNFTVGSQFSSLFQTGWNTLSFQVRNSGSGPTGLDVSLAGTAQATPEPATVGLMAISGLLLTGFGMMKRRQSVKQQAK